MGTMTISSQLYLVLCWSIRKRNCLSFYMLIWFFDWIQNPASSILSLSTLSNKYTQIRADFYLRDDILQGPRTLQGRCSVFHSLNAKTVWYAADLAIEKKVTNFFFACVLFLPEMRWCSLERWSLHNGVMSTWDFDDAEIETWQANWLVIFD